jgi:hypothetical protein
MDHIVREATEIEFHSNNMNKEVGFCLSKSWKPLICSLKKPEHDARSTRLHRSIHAQQLQPPGCWVNARSVALAFFPPLTSSLYLLWPALRYLLPWPCYRSLTIPLLSIDYPCDPLSLPPSVLI